MTVRKPDEKERMAHLYITLYWVALTAMNYTPDEPVSLSDYSIWSACQIGILEAGTVLFTNGQFEPRA